MDRFDSSSMTVGEVERQRRSAEAQLVSSRVAAEDQTGDDVVSKLPVSEREKLRAKISHLHKNLNHASPTVMADMPKRGKLTNG